MAVRTPAHAGAYDYIILVGELIHRKLADKSTPLPIDPLLAFKLRLKIAQRIVDDFWPKAKVHNSFIQLHLTDEQGWLSAIGENQYGDRQTLNRIGQELPADLRAAIATGRVVYREMTRGKDIRILYNERDNMVSVWSAISLAMAFQENLQALQDAIKRIPEANNPLRAFAAQPAIPAAPRQPQVVEVAVNDNVLIGTPDRETATARPGNFDRTGALAALEAQVNQVHTQDQAIIQEQLHKVDEVMPRPRTNDFNIQQALDLAIEATKEGTRLYKADRTDSIGRKLQIGDTVRIAFGMSYQLTFRVFVLPETGRVHEQLRVHAEAKVTEIKHADGIAFVKAGDYWGVYQDYFWKNEPDIRPLEVTTNG